MVWQHRDLSSSPGFQFRGKPKPYCGCGEKATWRIKVAAYYGCLLTRPAAVMQFDDPEQPCVLDELLNILGVETVKWSHKAECCGGSLAAAEPK